MKSLTLIDNMTDKVIAVLGMQGDEIAVLDGDKDAVAKFGLGKFSTLEQIENHFNQRSSTVHAVPDNETEIEKADAPQEPLPQGMPSVPTEDVDKRIAPAVQILKRLLEIAEHKQKEKAEDESQMEAALLEQQSAQAVQDIPYQAYVSIDGDNIGNKVFQAEEQDDEEAIKEISDKINAGQNLLRQWAEQNGGKVIEAGGDEGLVKVPSTALDHLEELRKQYFDLVGATLTVGVGKKISESTAARQLGKLRGKNTVVHFDEGTKKEIELRMEQQDIDCKEKLKNLIQSGASLSQPQEEVEETPSAPKFGIPEEMADQNQKDFDEYQKWINQGQPEFEKRPGQGVPPRIKKQRRLERRSAQEMAVNYGDDKDFLRHVLAGSRSKK